MKKLTKAESLAAKLTKTKRALSNLDQETKLTKSLEESWMENLQRDYAQFKKVQTSMSNRD